MPEPMNWNLRRDQRPQTDRSRSWKEKNRFQFPSDKLCVAVWLILVNTESAINFGDRKNRKFKPRRCHSLVKLYQMGTNGYTQTRHHVAIEPQKLMAICRRHRHRTIISISFIAWTLSQSSVDHIHLSFHAEFSNSKFVYSPFGVRETRCWTFAPQGHHEFFGLFYGFALSLFSLSRASLVFNSSIQSVKTFVGSLSIQHTHQNVEHELCNFVHFIQ